MPYSYSQYTGNGAQTAYTFSFPYIKKADIKVRVNDVLQTETTHYTVNETTKTITFLSAPANGATIDIRRDSKKDGVEVDYTNASTLTDENLDTSNLQNLYIVQEQLDLASARLGLGNDDKWDANSKVIKNITNGTNPQDAVTVGQVTGLVQAGSLITMPTVAGNPNKYQKSKDDATGYELISNSEARTELFTVGSRSVSSNDTLVASDQGNIITCTNSPTLSTTAAATLGSGWFCYVLNSGSGTVTIDPNASETINGQTTLTLLPGQSVMVDCTGSAFLATGLDNALQTSIDTNTSITITSSDRGRLLVCNNASPVAVTLPQAGSSFPNGWYVCLHNRGAGTVTITPTTSTIGGSATLTLTTGQGALVVSDGTNYNIFQGQPTSVAASQSDMEAASSNTVFVTPGRVQNHPGVSKAWAHVTVSGGTPSVTLGYNAGSLTDNGVGDFFCNVTNAFSSANFAFLATCERSSVPGGTTINTNPSSSPTTSGIRVVCYSEASNFLSGAFDPPRWSYAFFGDQ